MYFSNCKVHYELNLLNSTILKHERVVFVTFNIPFQLGCFRVERQQGSSLVLEKIPSLFL